ncbi:Fructose dehydrogenase cytochrome subunit precursor [Pseudooceanicola marinus]|uniref:Fructose dehydrogenase cytochrome subunit n=1 Tax=Pseudooceanicola marinus TaxID=396013 RepID=A0A1X6Y9J6_9RHOB|nr:hypothetical protein [Pseudooceanicola marinus]PJE33123.1 hypothetical protein CVM50_02445 [Pseudooceanicola marinus]SLN14634.1 Fructose dehydrogenase cytochrome subunit precursor [Pseudooceanicola marinus]
MPKASSSARPFWVIACLGAALPGGALAEPFEAGAFDSYQPDMVRGERLFQLGACASCHQDPAAALDPAAPLLAGGMKIDSPNYGLISVPNITGSAAGLGDWSRADFLNAMLYGLSPDGGEYTPLFPYEFYSGMKPEHVVDLFEYLKAEAPRSDRPSEDHELTLRYRLKRSNPWRYSFEPASYDGAGDSQADPVAWGQYIVENVAACGSCHTPRNSAFILQEDQALTGGISVLGEVAGDITKGAVSGLAPEDFVAHVLGDGMGLDLTTPVKGSMARVAGQLGQAPEEHRQAIFQYLADMPELPKPVIEMECAAPTPLVQTASPDLTARVDAYFNSDCKACHARGGSAAAQATLVSAAKTAADSSLVVPGDPGASALYKSLNRMPTSQAASDADRALIADWIESLAVNKELLTAEVKPPPRDPSRMHEGFAAEFAAVQGHLTAQDQLDRPFLRYFSFGHLENGQLPCQSMDDFRMQHLSGYVAALNKMVNSLSWEPRITRVEPIAEGASIFVIDIRDFGWTPFQWEVLVSGQIPGIETARPYPYGMDPQGLNADPNLKMLASVTGTQVPVMRGDWFVSNAGLPFTYKFMLGLPDDVATLEATRLRVDRIADIRNFDVMRAGFLEGASAVSQNNRLIERLEQPAGGYYWTSYDFDRGVDPSRRLKETPLGPAAAFPNSPHFEEDGGEMIFSLPNGMQGYYLTDPAGGYLDKGPTAVVFLKDPSPIYGTTISNGKACMVCHTRGPIEAYDNLREAVEATGADALTLMAVQRLHPEDDVLEAAYAEDTDRYLTALSRAGADMTIMEGPGRFHPEPVTHTASVYAENLDRDLLAAQFGLTWEAFQQQILSLPRHSEAFARVSGWLAEIDTRGEVERLDVELAWQQVAAGLYLTSPRGHPGVDAQEIQQHLAAYVPGHAGAGAETGTAPAQPVQAAAHVPAPAPKPVAQDRQTVTSAPGAVKAGRPGLTINVANPHLKVCEGVSFTVQTDQACLLDVIYPDTSVGSFFRLSPAAIGNPVLQPGEVRQVPQPGRELQSHTPSTGVDIAVNCYPGLTSYDQLGTDLMKTLEDYQRRAPTQTKNFSEVVSTVTEQTLAPAREGQRDPLAASQVPITSVLRFTIAEDRSALDANGSCLP